MRKKIFEVVEVAEDNKRISSVYDVFMILAIIISIIPLAFKTNYPLFIITDKITVYIFIVDYVLRLLTADYKLKKGGISFLIYPFTFMAIIDLVSILPSFNIFNNSLKILKLYRFIRTIRIVRLLKATRYSKNIQILLNVFRRSKDQLITVLTLAVIYILVSAMVILNVEPDSFGNYFDAIYWATVSLTTMGYGDLYPVTSAGRVVTIVSSFFGIAIIALPAGIITSAYTEELHKKEDQSE